VKILLDFNAKVSREEISVFWRYCHWILSWIWISVIWYTEYAPEDSSEILVYTYQTTWHYMWSRRLLRNVSTYLPNYMAWHVEQKAPPKC
jgi:hypothetical protein